MVDNLKDMQASQYLLMSQRCMHELKTVRDGRMDEEEDGSKSICVTELGQRVLTLQEVI